MIDFLKRRSDELETILNWVSDQDREWWPFLFLRPPRARRLTSIRVALIAALYGTFVGMFANAMIALTVTDRGKPSLVTLPVLTTLSFFAVFRLTFAYSWNRRARRLAAALERTTIS